MKKTFNLVKKVSVFMLAGLLLFTGCAETTGNTITNNTETTDNTNNDGSTEENTDNENTDNSSNENSENSETNTEETESNSETNTEETESNSETNTEETESNSENNTETNPNQSESTTEDFETNLTSVQMAKNMSIGWNLGNTLDATYYQDSEYNAGLDTEIGWEMPKTTKEMITSVREAGFKTIRIPVSWHNHISDITNYTIDSAWMARVKEVVDYAYSQGMYVIINIHHDNMKITTINSAAGFALSDNADVRKKSKTFIKNVWLQIATTFADYNEKLVFEVLNEPRDVGGEFCGNEWWTDNKAMVDIITEYEQVAIDAIRSVKGNKNRFIMVPGYAASGSDINILKLYTMPTDSSNDKLILSTHAYSPYNFAMNDSTDKTFGSDDKASLDSIFAALKSNYTDKGIGVVMGEASASDKNNLSDRVEWATYYFTKAKEAGIPVILWDNMVTVENGGNIDSGECHGYYDRNENSWFFPTMITAMMNAVRN